MPSKHLRDLCETDHDLGYELFKRISEVMMQRLQIAEWLAHQQGKYTQRVNRDGKTFICVFTCGCRVKPPFKQPLDWQLVNAV